MSAAGKSRRWGGRLRRRTRGLLAAFPVCWCICFSLPAQQEHRLISTITLDGTPLGAAVTADNTRLVVTTGQGELVFFSLKQMKVLARMRLQGSPLYLYRPPQSRMALVGLWNGTRIAVVDMFGNRVVRSMGVGDGPTYFAQDQRAVLLALTRARKLVFLSPYTFKPTGELAFDETVAGVAAAPQSRRAYVALAPQKVGVVDLDSRSLLRTFNAALAPDTPLWIDPAERWLFAFGTRKNVVRISLEQEKEDRRMSTGGAPTGMALAPDGRYLYVSNGLEGTVAVLEASSLANLEQISVGGRPSWIEVSSDSRLIFICNRGSNSISVLERVESP